MKSQDEIMRDLGLQNKMKVRIEEKGRELGEGVVYLKDGSIISIAGGSHYVGKEVLIRIELIFPIENSDQYIVTAYTIDDED